MHTELERLKRENELLKARLSADPYIKIEELGAGGFCTVWRSAERIDDKHFIEVCLKELKPQLREDADCVRYFQREARIASNLRHPNIVLLIKVDDARFRLVYQLVDGVDLGRLLAHAGGRLGAEFVIVVGQQISSALECAHSRTKEDAPAGVIHRDLKPANVLVSVDGQVMLADFGVAAIESPNLQTSIRGTTAYMSPEQARGLAVDAGTDLFSLGVVLYELLAGRRPFDGDGDGAASFERLGRGVYPPLESIVPDAPPALLAIIARLLRPIREERYQSASDVFAALSAIAPSHDIRRALGALAKGARRRKTKDYQSLQQARETQALPLALTSGALDQRVHEATTLVRRPAIDEPSSTVVPGKETPRRAKQRWWAAAVLVPMLTAAMFLVSRAQSPAREVVHAEAAPVAAEKAAPPTLVAIDRSRLIDPAPSEGEPTSEGATAPAPSAAVAPSSEEPPAPGASTSAPEQRAGALIENAPAEATLRVSADKSAPVQIDGRLAGWSPLRIAVAPGAHTIVVGAAGAQKTIRAEIAPGATKNIFVNLRRPKTTN